jgi:hypothetical protein
LSVHANRNYALHAFNKGDAYRFFTKPLNLLGLTATSAGRWSRKTDAHSRAFVGAA